MWTKGQSWLRRTYTSLAGMPTETPREVRFNFKIGSNGLQNSQNLSHSFAIPWWVFNQKIKTSLWISWVLKRARKRWGTQEHPQSPKREIWQKKKWSKSNDFLAVASLLYIWRILTQKIFIKRSIYHLQFRGSSQKQKEGDFGEISKSKVLVHGSGRGSP